MSRRGSWTVRPQAALAVSVALATVLLLVTAAPVWADETRYRMPPQAIADLIAAPPTPAVSLDPQGNWLLLLERPSLPPIEEIAQPELRLAGLRINPRTNGPSRTSYYTGLLVKHVRTGDSKRITGFGEDARLGNVQWSPDGTHVAFTNTRDQGIELWVAEIESGKAQRVTDAVLNGAYGTPYTWDSDNPSFVCRFVPADRGAAPEKPLAPAGPIIQENIGKKAPARTYQDLLQNAHDEALFDYYMTSKVVRVGIDGTKTDLTEPAIITDAEPSPNGEYVMTATIHRPFSYLVPLTRFPKRVDILDRSGHLVRTVADLPLQEEIPIGFNAVPTGPRSIAWRDDAPATVYWTEAQDGGDPDVSAEVRDRLFTLDSPFDGEPVTLVSLALRDSGIAWGDEHLALVSEWWWKNRKVRTWIIDPGKPETSPRLLYDRSFEDRYHDPGSPLMRITSTGSAVLLTTGAGAGKRLFFRGAGASEEGDRPFLDRLELATKETERLMRSQAPYYEVPIDLVDAENLLVVTRRETKTEPPNFYLRDLEDDTIRPLTDFPHPMPQLKDVYKEQIRYERADGVKLTATLYLPPGKKPKDGPFPMLMWAYPQEYKSADAAGQVTDSPYRFVRTSSGSPLLWLVHGYAVLDDPSLPIVGEGDEEPNDHYVEQLVAGAKAAVDEVVRRGVADRDRIAVGGHSYGAFMAANLLAHSDLFCAGIARSGAYNRTLTPFGFQAEERTFWEAPEVYFAMSPFMHADKINEPILLIHGEADNNSGTFPLQSKRFYSALKGLGATARLVLLPHESHGYRARESVMHMAYEMTQWLDTYVKNAKPRE